MAKRLIYLIVVFLLVYFILQNLNDGKVLLETLLGANLGFVGLALMLQLVRYLLIAKVYQKALGLFQIKWDFIIVVNMVLASVSLNIFAPLAPFPGSSVFIQKTRTEDKPAISAIGSIFLVVLFDYLALAPLLALSLIFQFKSGGIFKYELLGIMVFLIIIIMLFVILTFGVLSPKILKSLFWLAERVVNGLHKLIKNRRFFIHGWHESRTMQFIEVSQKILDRKNSKKDIYVSSLLKHLADIGTLFLLFLAFGKVLSLPVLIIGFSLMILFWLVSPTPQGVGFVETITPAVFASMGVSTEIATLAVLAYRGINLWIPVLIGFGALHRLLGQKD